MKSAGDEAVFWIDGLLCACAVVGGRVLDQKGLVIDCGRDGFPLTAR